MCNTTGTNHLRRWCRMGKAHKARKVPTRSERVYVKRFLRGDWAGLDVCRNSKCDGRCDKWHQ